MKSLQLIIPATDHTNEQTEFEDSYFKAISESEDLIKQYQTSLSPLSHQESTLPVGLLPTYPKVETTNIQYKLPQIDVPTFTGL